MIQIDMPMPEKCSDCIFCDDNCSCVASDYDGIGINVGCAYRTGRRDIRCPLKEQDCKGCSTVFDVAYKAGKKDAVVRCKDCKHRGDRNKCIIAFVAEKQEMPYFFYDNRGEWFCADGVKKND